MIILRRHDAADASRNTGIGGLRWNELSAGIVSTRRDFSSVTLSRLCRQRRSHGDVCEVFLLVIDHDVAPRPLTRSTLAVLVVVATSRRRASPAEWQMCPTPPEPAWMRTFLSLFQTRSLDSACPSVKRPGG